MKKSVITNNILGINSAMFKTYISNKKPMATNVYSVDIIGVNTKFFDSFSLISTFAFPPNPNMPFTEIP